MSEKLTKDILEGLSAKPKYLKSCYLYNPKGDRLFQEKMAMSEYYLTKCEYDIFLNHKDKIMNIFTKNSESINRIELGAGDGRKTKILLENHVRNDKNLTYVPIDISQSVLNDLKDTLSATLPDLHVNPIAGDFVWALKKLQKSEDKRRKVVLFIGSTIGNIPLLECDAFLLEIASCLNSDDLVLIGFDLIKSPQIIRKAYTLGSNKAFYKNILERINDEFEGNFDLANFEHYFSYNPINGLGETFLISKKEQQVKLASLDTEISFDNWESIHISFHQKYDDEHIKNLAEKSGFEVIHSFYDSQKYYSNSIWRLK